jgi:uncharacterized protein YecE (DUF72 family)
MLLEPEQIPVEQLRSASILHHGSITLIDSPVREAPERAVKTARQPPRVCAAFEFRHATWYVDEVYALLRERGVALVIPDSPKYPFRELELTADWTFVRFHYGTRGRNGNYSETEIREWADRIDGWRRDGVGVYAYYNNDWEGYAVRNGLRLKELLDI